MEGLCYTFSEDDNVKPKGNDLPNFQDFWDYAKKNLLNEKLIKRVKGFKLENVKSIPEIKINKLRQFVINPLFDKDKVFNASQAAGNLSLWIRAVLETYEAVGLMETKKQELLRAEDKLRVAELIVAEKQKALEEALELLNILQQEYEKLINEQTMI